MQRYAKKSILRVLWRPSWISSKYYCYTCKKKWNPIFFLSRSYSEPESVAKSILTNKKKRNYKWTCTISTMVRAAKTSSSLQKSIQIFIRSSNGRIQYLSAMKHNSSDLIGVLSPTGVDKSVLLHSTNAGYRHY